VAQESIACNYLTQMDTVEKSLLRSSAKIHNLESLSDSWWLLSMAEYNPRVTGNVTASWSGNEVGTSKVVWGVLCPLALQQD
jgi:hypothetical protein